MIRHRKREAQQPQHADDEPLGLPKREVEHQAERQDQMMARSE